MDGHSRGVIPGEAKNYTRLGHGRQVEMKRKARPTSLPLQKDFEKIFLGGRGVGL